MSVQNNSFGLGRMVSPEDALGWIGKFEDDGTLSLTRHSLSLVHTVTQQAERLAKVEALFAGGPDTPCRTVWRNVEVGTGPYATVRVECVEVPMEDLRAALTDQPK